ncbi:venom dipeptidyl peptidase 4-like isoform X1 [Bradysia coprophila]|uniref:venom dipeptidyl peptidase 4-like isoform X1 n=1 Tax=Bradysia coprophila TaxID=38358 RepID=UPI00187D87F3|nr:venom dipeptidyl peptidase 4-like isoform X1 [Bradysia coprophila]
MATCRKGKCAILCLVYLSIGCITAIPVNTRQSDKLPFEFDDIFPSRFSFRGFNGSWISDDQFIFRSGDLQAYNVTAENAEFFLEASVLSRYPTYTFSADYKKILNRYDVTSIFRHSIVARYRIYDIESGNEYSIGNGELLNFCVWSPNGEDVAFVFKNNVFVRRASGEEIQLTSDGVDGVIYNGVPDWVYEEEVLGSGGALWFSPNGQKIAIGSFDDTEVEEFTYVLYEDQYEKEVALRYPKPGRVNPTVAFRYIDLTDDTLTWHQFPAPIEKVKEDHILYSVNWITDDLVGAFWLNRRQNEGSYQICSTSGDRSCFEGFELREPEGWVEISTPRCTPSGDHCFFIGFGNGNWRNVHRYTLSTPGVAPIPMFPDEFTVQSINGFSDDGNDVYFTTTLTHQPHTRHVYKNNECLTCEVTGSEDEVCEYASASFSQAFTYFALSCSGPRPSYTRIYRTADRLELISWEENTANRERLNDYQRPLVHFENVPVANGFTAAVKLTLPPEIDLNSSTQKYPMVVEVYGGPNSVRVTNSFSIGFKDYQVTSRKIIHCQIDGRGSGNKGKQLLFTMNNRMGTVEIEDQIAVTKYLQQKYRFIDETRTGIWGWSYGGYATAMALSTDTEHIFKCGVSVAPVSAWIYYDSIYTERYMGLPTDDDNIVNYNATDVTQHINELKNHELLLMHGNADDNVHFQQAMVLTKALVNADVQFEQASYPNEAHGLSGVTRHVYHTIDKFWGNCFNLDS